VYQVGGYKMMGFAMISSHRSCRGAIHSGQSQVQDEQADSWPGPAAGNSSAERKFNRQPATSTRRPRALRTEQSSSTMPPHRSGLGCVPAPDESSTKPASVRRSLLSRLQPCFIIGLPRYTGKVADSARLPIGLGPIALGFWGDNARFTARRHYSGRVSPEFLGHRTRSARDFRFIFCITWPR